MSGNKDGSYTTYACWTNVSESGFGINSNTSAACDPTAVSSSLDARSPLVRTHEPSDPESFSLTGPVGSQGFSGVFCDQGYWQVSASQWSRQISRRRRHAHGPLSTASDRKSSRVNHQSVHVWRHLVVQHSVVRFSLSKLRAPLTNPRRAFGSVMGLSARGLLRNPTFPTFPYALSSAQQSAGLVAPAAAVVLLGKGGAAAVLLVTVRPVLCPDSSPLQSS